MKNGLRRQKEKLRKQGYKFGYELAAELGICYETLRRSAEQDPDIKVHRIPAGKRTFVMYKIVNKANQSNNSST